MAAGILDPTKVVRVALLDAASVVGLLITTEGMAAPIGRNLRAYRASPRAAWITSLQPHRVSGNGLIAQHGSLDIISALLRPGVAATPETKNAAGP